MQDTEERITTFVNRFYKSPEEIPVDDAKLLEALKRMRDAIERMEKND